MARIYTYQMAVDQILYTGDDRETNSSMLTKTSNIRCFVETGDYVPIEVGRKL